MVTTLSIAQHFPIHFFIRQLMYRDGSYLFQRRGSASRSVEPEDLSKKKQLSSSPTDTNVAFGTPLNNTSPASTSVLDFFSRADAVSTPAVLSNTDSNLNINPRSDSSALLLSYKESNTPPISFSKASVVRAASNFRGLPPGR